MAISLDRDLEGRAVKERDRIEWRTWGGRIGLALLSSFVFATAATPSHAQTSTGDGKCSDYPGGVIDGNFINPSPSQIQIDQNCIFQNFTGSNPLDTNISFKTTPGQTDERWLVIFNNVEHIGQMSCNANAGHTIWFTNTSTTGISPNCQDLFIPVEKIDKAVPPGQTTATIGVPFTYTLTIPVLFDPAQGTVVDDTGSENELHSIVVTDDLNDVAADLTYVSHSVYEKGTNTPIAHTFSNVGGLLTFSDFPIVAPFDQIVVEITVVLDNSPINAPGTQFTNTAKWDFGRLIDGTFYDPLPGEWGISETLTIANPDLVVTKTGPTTLGLTMNLGQWGTFGIDAHNTGLSDAWNVTLVDLLPDGPSGGMCDLTPEIVSAQVYLVDGTTPAPGKAPLVQGTDFTFSYAPAPTCQLTMTTLTADAAIGPDERLIITYRTQMDSDTQDGIALTNVAGATRWFNGDPSNTARIEFNETVSTGTVGQIDHEDAHTVTSALSGYFFEKSVANLTAGVSPATTAQSGDTLRYTIRLQATDVALTGLSIVDDLGDMNAPGVLVPGSLAIVPGTLPAGAIDASLASGGTNGLGLLDVRNVDVPANSEIQFQFDVDIAAAVPHGTAIINQADLVNVVKIADSDDPFINGQADPAVPGDEDPTQVVIAAIPAGPLLKEVTQATAAIGEAFSYRITVPASPHPNDIYDVRITDDLTVPATGADLRYVGVTRISGPGTWVPTNTGSDTNIVIEDTDNGGIDIPAGEQIVVEIHVALANTATNVAGVTFGNTASFEHHWIDDDIASTAAGEPSTAPDMTIVEPDLFVSKTGPAGISLGVPASYGLDVENVGTSTAWHPTLVDRLPSLSPGGTCDVAPSNVSARVFDATGTNPVSPVLIENTDFTVSFAGDPTCEFTIDFTSDAASPAPGEHLIVSYEALLDFDTPDGALLTNVAGATSWFSTNGSDPRVIAYRRTYSETLSDGTVGLDDHEDAHTIASLIPIHEFQKTVRNVSTNTSPALTATPGDRLEYTITVRNVGSVSMDDFTFSDELDRLNGLPSFEPNTLIVTSAPGTAVVSVDPIGGAAGTGSLQVSGLNLPNNLDELTIVFEAVLASPLPDGGFVSNQASLLLSGQPFSYSDDPNVVGDDDPTRVQITSSPDFQIEKTSADVTGDPAVLLPGDTLRYTITVKNVGTEDAFDASILDAVPVGTSYVPGTTTLNAIAVPDGPSSSSPLASGLLINAPENPTAGSMRADSDPAADNVAEISFDVVVDAAAADGTIVSNQAFVSAVSSGVVDQPSDDPDTTIVDDPTRDVVGSTPLLFASKDAALVADNNTNGVIDAGDVLEYTIQVFNTGLVAATGAVLQDAIPTHTSYVADSTTMNSNPVPDVGGGSPLVAGLSINSPDLASGSGTVSPGESALVTFRLLVLGTATTGTVIANQALVTTAEAPNLLTDGDGNPSTGPEPTLVVVGATEQLAITKQVSVVGGGPALPGSVLEYLVTVTNVGPIDATNLLITDDLAAPVAGQLAYVPGSGTLDGAGAGVSLVGTIVQADFGATYGALAPGDATVLRFRATLDGALTQGTAVLNVAQVDWGSPPNLSDTASVSISVGGLPGVSALNGVLWHDVDLDGVMSGADLPLTGWLVDLYRNGQPVLTVTADGSGAYGIAGLSPNDTNGDVYELRFRAPDAGPTSAALGTPISPFTNTPQSITGVTLASGDNLQGIDLPISPNGVVFASVQRVPIAGATLQLLNAVSGSALPPSCFDDPVQQGQVTRADGYYKFDINFSDAAACPNGGSYLLDVAPPPTGYTAGASVVMPPSTDASTPALQVPICGGGPNDAIPATPLYCEVQDSISPPPTSVPPGDPAAAYYLHLALDDSQADASSQAFNNHVPIDPVVDSFVGITKTTPKLNVVIGELVPYEIVLTNLLDSALSGVEITDQYPAGFKYVEGSARIDGTESEPTQTGRNLLWTGLDVGPRSELRLQLLLAVGAGVTEGEFTNAAFANLSSAGLGPSSLASATVRVVPDPDFACTDVLGKVFDDRNLDGEQDDGEPGLSGVRLVTPRGLAATTDAYGRFHITCAIVPNEQRGSNFLLKLDDRTLPAGYRLSTPKAQVKRATRGKALRFSYGAAIHRIVSLDLADPVFEPGTTEMRAHWLPRLDLLVAELAESPASLRITYAAETEKRSLVEARLRALERLVAGIWHAGEEDREALRIETEIVWTRGAPAKASALNRFSRGIADALMSPFEDGDGVEPVERVSRTEQPLPDDVDPTLWAIDPARNAKTAGDRLEVREVVRDRAETKKLRNVVDQIHFESGAIDIPDGTIDQLGQVLAGMQHLDNVRLHLVGHADDQPLSGAMQRQYGDNTGLSRERAGEAAEFVQRALSLPPESISFDGLGSDYPIASNDTEAGRRQNRRVEIEVWYDVVGQEVGFEDVVIPDEITQVKVCRMETVCKMRFKDGHARRARIRNLVAPLQVGSQTVNVPDSFIREIEQALENLRDQQNVTVKFIGYSDDAPLTERASRIYGTHQALSTAHARRVALAVQEALQLPTSNVESEGRGTTRPIASNATERGRDLNRRVEVEFWHDDPLQELSEDTQLCPDQWGDEVLTRIHDPAWGRIDPIPLEDGEPLVPEGHPAIIERALSEVSGRMNARLRFVGYVGNERLDRRTALAYGDDIGLSTARARRTMEILQTQLGLRDDQVEYEGRGFRHSNDVVNAGFITGETSEVRVEVVYDERAEVDALEGIAVTPITREIETRSTLDLNLMRISVDGVPIDDPGRSSADVQRCTDVALNETAIRLAYNELPVTPRLTVTADPYTVATGSRGGGGLFPSREGPGAGGSSAIRFRTYTNYSHYIDRMEVRIYDRGQSPKSEPVAAIGVEADGTATWQPPSDWFASPMRQMEYVLRAYDAAGRFDESVAQPLWLVHGDGAPAAVDGADGNGPPGAGVLAPTEGLVVSTNGGLYPGYGEAWPIERRIPFGSAGTVRVTGEGISPEQTVAFAGRPVPTDEHGRFVAEEILPSGIHTVEIAVQEQDGTGELFLRDLEIEENSWFFTGIADLTLSGGGGHGDPGALAGANPAMEQDSTAEGRLAFFLQGRFGDDWQLTASADTDEGDIGSLFTNFLDTTPSSLFRRIEPEYFYPTYGDDGTVQQLAPSQGKMYVRLAKDESHLLWGNYIIDYDQNELAMVERGLYGGNLRWQSESQTGFGEKRFALDGFGADAGTLSTREEFRGTGGSLYYLRRNDLTIGSDRVRIEIRDKASGLVKSVVDLTPGGIDYDVDYLQGRILLREPLAATVDDDLVVRTGGLSGDEAWLVVQYEYAPGFDDIGALSAGGQGHYWFGDFLKLGFTASHDEGGDEDSNLYGADLTLRRSGGSWLKLQYGRSEGQFLSTWDSTNGGFDFIPDDDFTGLGAEANAYRGDLVASFADFVPGMPGGLSVYGQQVEAGYSATGLATGADLLQAGGAFQMPLLDSVNLNAKADWSRQDGGLETNTAEVDVEVLLTDAVRVSAGFRNDSREDDSPVQVATQETGRRTDVAVEVGYDGQGIWDVYGFGQGTVSSSGNREDNVRYGAGGTVQVNDRLSTNGEVSYGDGGIGARVGSNYQYATNSSTYITYALENERSGAGSRRRGNFITGARDRFSDSGSVFAENRYTHSSIDRGLVQAAGIETDFFDRWTLGLSVEVGTLTDRLTQAETKRRAAGGSVGYSFGDVDLQTAVEFRYDETQQPDGSWSDRTTWLFKNSAEVRLNPDWRLLATFNHSFSNSSLGDFFGGGFTEATFGYAYRPVRHDRLHTLVKYTYFHNLPTTAAVTGQEVPAFYAQRSHIAAVDATYDLTRRISLGAKYAFRSSQVSLDRVDPNYFSNDANLYIARADYDITAKWEILAEGRMLHLPDIDERKAGALVGLYRYFGDHFKAGVGYNFTDFSEDLTDLSYDHHGWFINMVGSF